MQLDQLKQNKYGLLHYSQTFPIGLIVYQILKFGYIIVKT